MFSIFWHSPTPTPTHQLHLFIIHQSMTIVNYPLLSTMINPPSSLSTIMNHDSQVLNIDHLQRPSLKEHVQQWLLQQRIQHLRTRVQGAAEGLLARSSADPNLCQGRSRRHWELLVGAWYCLVPHKFWLVFKFDELLQSTTTTNASTTTTATGYRYDQW